MALSESYRNFILDQLSDLGTFETRNMFGGTALLHCGHAFAKVKHDTLWLKADDSNRADFIDAGMPQYTYGKDGSRKLNFYEAPAEVIDDPEQLVAWAKRSMKVATGAAR